MPADISISRPRRIWRYPPGGTLTGFILDPLKQSEEIERKSGGDIVQLNIGPLQLCIATRPDHVQHGFRDSSGNFWGAA